MTAISSDSPSQSYLRFRLGSTRALLPAGHLTEVLSLSPEQVLPIPDLPAWVLGVHNWRGEVLWLADLGALAGFPSLWDQAPAQIACIIIHQASNRRSVGNKFLGLGVAALEDLERCQADQIQALAVPPSSPGFALLLQGYRLSPDREVLPVLDPAAILEQVQTHSLS